MNAKTFLRGLPHSEAPDCGLNMGRIARLLAMINDEATLSDGQCTELKQFVRAQSIILTEGAVYTVAAWVNTCHCKEPIKPQPE